MIFDDVFFVLSVRNVRLHFLRSVLAVVGIIIGVVAIASMGIMGANLTVAVTEELSSSGNVIMVTPASGGGNGFGAHSGSTTTENVIDNQQVKEIEKVAGTNAVIPLHSTSDQIEVGSKMGWVAIYGLDTDDMRVQLNVEEGKFISGTSGALIGPRLAEDYELKSGSRIKIGDEDDGRETIRVVGVLEERGMSMDMYTDNAIIVSDHWYTDVYGGENEYDQVNIVVENLEEIEEIKEGIDRKLNKGKDDEVNIIDSGSILEMITNTLSTITVFVSGIAGISLLVAAVSIFNVMMMSVTERIKEIGILRSIGTRKSWVRRMFIYEAFILGFVGSGIGGLLSLAGGYGLVMLMVQDTQYFFSFESLINIPYAMVIGIIICLASGVYPAWKASNLDPIEALATE